jgi:hypothetical protein
VWANGETKNSGKDAVVRECCFTLPAALAFVHGQPGRAAVGIRHHPGAGCQHRRHDGFSFHWKGLGWPATMGTHTSSVNMPICNVESATASRA